MKKILNLMYKNDTFHHQYTEASKQLYAEMLLIDCIQYILNETSKPPVNKTHFQYSSNIIKLFEMIFDTVYLGTCMRRLNITKFDSIRMFIDS